MTQVEKLLQVARAEIGVAEDPLGSNKTKYGEAYGCNGVPWCMEFAWWCFHEAGLSHLFYDGKKTASCTTLMKWAQREGRFFMGGYRPGDVFLYQFDEDSAADHTGIYTGQVDGRGRYLVIEGNHNNRVEVVARSDSELWGAFRAEWDDPVDDPVDAPGDEYTPSVDGVCIRLPEIRKGSVGASVKSMQILLMGYGCRLPRYGADGEYGAETGSALKNYQTMNRLSVDGVCGKDTWSKLLGVCE